MEVSQLFQKMQSSVSDEVRQRALVTVVTKARCKLIDLDDYCLQNSESVITLMYWLQDFYQTSSLERALWLLHQMTQRPQTLIRLKQSSAAAQFLCSLRDWLEQNNQPQSMKQQLEQILSLIVQKEDHGMKIKVLPKVSDESNKENAPQNQTMKVDQNILEKPKIEVYDFILLPPIRLFETDEKLLFDIQVQLKFGNTATLIATFNQILAILNNFPIEVLKTKFELVELIITLAHNTSEAVQYYALTTLRKIIKKIQQRIQLHQKKEYQNAFRYQGGLKEHIESAYPTLDGRYTNKDQQFEDLYLENTINHKQFKQIIEMICVGILKQNTKFPGLRILIIDSTLNLLVFTNKFAPEATQNCIINILKGIVQFLDRFDTPLKEVQCIPLMLTAVDLFCQLPEEKTSNPDLKRLSSHLGQLQFVNVLEESQSRDLLVQLANDTETVVQNGRIDQVLKSVKTLWDHQAGVSKQIICLSLDELERLVEIQKEILLGVPLAQDKTFISGYFRAYLYAQAYNSSKEGAQENLIKCLYAPCRVTQQIIYTQILQCLNDPSFLTLPKYKETLNICQLTKQILQNENIILNVKNQFYLFSYQLVQNALASTELLKITLDILIRLAQEVKLNKTILTLCQIVISYADENQSSQCELLKSLIQNQDSMLPLTQALIQLFSKDKRLRIQASSLLAAKSYCNSILQGQTASLPLITTVQQKDFLEDLIQQSKLDFGYDDLINEGVTAIIKKEKSSQQMNCSIENISNLESLATQDIEVGLKSAAIEQLTQIYMRFQSDESGFAKSTNVKLSQLRDFWCSVIQNIAGLLQKESDSRKLYTQIPGSAYSLFISSIIDLLSIFVTFNPIENQFRKEFDIDKPTELTFSVLKVCLHYLTILEAPKQLRFSAVRLIYVMLFSVRFQNFPLLSLNKNKFMSPCAIPSGQTIEIISHWALFYPLPTNADWYVTKYIECLQQNMDMKNPAKILSKLLVIPENTPAPQLVEWLYTLQQLSIYSNIEYTQTIESIILHPDFLNSSDLYLIRLISKLEKNPLDKLQRQVMQMFSESQNEELGQILALHLRLCVLQKKKPQIKEDQIFTILEQLPFNELAITSLLKLAKKKLISLNKELTIYLCTQCLAQSEFRFQQCQLPTKFLTVTLGNNIMDYLPEVDKSILFSQFMQFTRSRITELRCLSLNHLRNHLQDLNEEQQHRLSQECLDIIFSQSEAQAVISISIQIINEILVIQAYQDQEDLKQFLQTKRVISHFTSLIQLNGTTFVLKATLTRLVATLVQYWEQEFSSAIITSNFILFLQKDILSNLSVKKLLEKQQTDGVALYISAICGLLIQMLRQNVTQALQLMQTYNIIDLCTRLLRKIAKIIQEELPYSQYQLQFTTVQIIQVIKLCCISGPDIACIDLRAVNKNKNFFTNLLICLKNEKFEQSKRTEIASSIPTIIHTGYDNLDDNDQELVLTLNSIITETTIISQAVSSIISFSNKAKQAVVSVRLPEHTANTLTKELDAYLLGSSSNQSTNQNNKSVKQKTIMNQSIITVQFTQNEDIKECVEFLRLLYARANDGIQLETKFIGTTINITIQILHKLLILHTKQQLAINYFQVLLTNLSTNPQLQNIFVQKMTEDKFSLISDLSKLALRQDIQIPEQVFDIILRCLSAMGQNQEFRIVFNRMKIVPDLVDKFILLWERKKQWSPNNSNAKSIIFFLLSLSFIQDSEQKLITSSKLMNIYLTILKDHGMEFQLSRDILLMLMNCALKSKSIFLMEQSFPPLVLELITDNNNDPVLQYWSSQLLVNLLYKSTQAIAQFNKSENIKDIESSMRTTQRIADKLQLQQPTLQSEKDKAEQQRQLYQKISNNLNQIIRVLKSEW